MYETIRWRGNRVELIDQRLLPHVTKYIICKTSKDIYEAIKKMKIRGAPAIGVASLFGVYLGMRGSHAKSFDEFKKELGRVIKFLASARPTARNLFWALERASAVVDSNRHLAPEKLKKTLLKEAILALSEDKMTCHAIGSNGASLVPKASCVLTHCNAGALATAGYGTALGVIFSAKRKIRRVYVDETRPRLQGARLTVWELVKSKIPATLICDNMAASLMAKKKIDLVIVGADRIAANGDTANKIGTYGLAVLAKYHKIPFYVAAPISTFDLALTSGRDIPIEEREALEVKKIGDEYITVKDVDVANPAFDVTPAGLITAIITERGVIKYPNTEKIRKHERIRAC